MKSWLSWALFGGIGAILLLTVGSVVAFYTLRSYLRGDDFRVLASKAVSSSLKVEGEFKPFQWEGTSVYTEGFDARGRADSALGKIKSDQLSAEFNIKSLFVPPYQLNHLNLDTLRIDFVTPREDLKTVTAPTPKPAPAQDPASEAEDKKKAAKFRIEQINVRDATITWPGPGSAENVRIEAQPEEDMEGWKLDLTGGKLRQDSVDTPMNLDTAKLRFKDQTLYVTNARMRPAEGIGDMMVNGTVAFQPRTRLNLQVDVNRMEVERFLPPDWRAKLTGRLIGIANVVGYTDTKGGIVVSGDARLEEGILQALPQLEDIAKVTAVDDFRKIHFHTATATFNWSETKLEITNIKIFSKELLGIEGTITKVGDQITGNLRVGITPDALSLAPGVFTDPRDGLLWTTVRLSGTEHDLKEDLTPRLTTAAIKNLPQTAVDKAEQVLDKAREIVPGLPKLPDLKIRF
ncbi:MAG: hypothetical protein ACAI35_11265 [Candidatus Methylacidiphilales bacterium]|nr:hypothetical protein [Candidatus Methylacidiphilales bacterium]